MTENPGNGPSFGVNNPWFFVTFVSNFCKNVMYNLANRQDYSGCIDGILVYVRVVPSSTAFAEE